MYYIDVPETTNIDCVLDSEKILAAQATNVLTVTAAISSTMVFSIEAGVFTITATGLTDGLFEAGDTIIIRNSVQIKTDTEDYVNNDGCYTIVTSILGGITVEEPVIAATSDSLVADVDEYATFILHPTRRTGQICTFVEIDANLATFEISFRPGGFWAAKLEPGIPIYQMDGVLSKMYLIQVETAPYLQTEEEDLDTSAITDIDKKGTMLMRVFAPHGGTLTAGSVEVSFVQLA